LIALRKTSPGAGHLELCEVPRPVPADGEVLVRVAATGICGSDLHILNWDTKVTMAPPVTIGHEFSGTVAEVAGDGAGLKPGDRVTGEPTYRVCGNCLHCRSGAYNLCPQRKVLGFAADGAFAEFVRVPAGRLHLLPARVDFRVGAMSEPLACCVHGLYELTGITPGELAVVSGPGAIGQLCAQLLKAAGACVAVIGTGADAERLALARRLGADYTFSSEQDPASSVAELTGGVGADVVVECSGAGAAAAMGLELVRRGGKYTQMGMFGRPISVDFERIAYKEIRVVGSFAQKWSAWKRGLQLLGEGRLRLEALVSDVLPLGDWQKGFDRMAAKQGFKILLAP
jgi:L-iditol 2-dehydrogenase